MIIIGQFAKDNNITVKTLHHYEKVGLLNPLKVDTETGYRYYGDISQDDLDIILFLKELGFSLSEIKSSINEFELDSILDLFAFKLDNLQNDTDLIESRIFKIQNILSSLHLSKNNINWKGIVKMSKETTDSGNYGKGRLIESRDKAFKEAKAGGSQFCLVVLDLDHFQKINDDFGYSVGDQILDRTYSEISAYIKTVEGNISTEYRGGDEYHLTFTKSPKEVALLISTLLDNIVKVDYSDIDEDIKVSATAGIVAVSKKHKSYSDLLQDASIKLYENKNRNR